MLGSAGSAGSAGVESPDDADETCALMRSTGLLREPGDAVASGDVARSCNSTAPERASSGGCGGSPSGLVLNLMDPRP